MRTSPCQSPSRLPAPIVRWRPLLVLLAAFTLHPGGPARGGVPELTPGQELTRELAGGGSHRYPFSLTPGQLLRAVVAEDGIDVEVRLLDPAGQEVMHVDGPRQPHDDEDLAAIAEQAGLYQLEVRAGAQAKPGHYRLRVELRQAGGDDRARVEAVRLTQAAAELTGKEGALRQQIAKRQQALALWQRLGERAHEAAACHHLGTAHYAIDELKAAEEDLQQAAALWQKLGAQANRADALNELGRTNRRQGRLLAAREHFEEALAQLAEPGAPPHLKVDILNNLGNVLIDLGRPRDAIPRLTAALALAQSTGESGAKVAEVNVLNNLGSAYTDLGESQEALRCYKESLDRSREDGQRNVRSLRAAALNNMGLLYDSLGDRQQALEYFQRALDLDRALGQREQEARTLNNIGLTHQRLDEPEPARQAYGRALALAQEMHDQRTEAMTSTNLGFLDLSLGRLEAALAESRTALALAAGDERTEAIARNALGAVYRRRGQLAAAETELERARALSHTHEDLGREANVTLELARVARDRGDLDAVLTRIGPAIEMIESLRTRVANPDLRAVFLASKQDYYELDIHTLMDLNRGRPAGGYDAAALQVSERARARSLLEILNSSGASPREDAPPSQLLPLPLPEIQKLLDDRTLLLEYALGEERSYLWAVTPAGITGFELPPRGQIEAVARRFYEQLVAHPTGRARADAAAAVAARELAGMVLAPAAGLLADRRLLVVSDGALQYVPFAALPDPVAATSTASAASAAAPYLVERHEIVSLPSASVLAVLRQELATRPPAPLTLAVLADPVFQRADERLAQPSPALPPISRPGRTLAQARRAPLPERDCSSRIFHRLRFSGREADAIANLVPRESLLKAVGFAASLPTATGGDLAHYRLVHFATHGCLDSQHPELSGLVLSRVDAKGRDQEGFLKLRDIYNLDLHADLVVLSACQTALGKEIRGEGLIGLTRGFMYAGAARVLASLWSVEDRATAELMTRLYGAMLGKAPQRPAAALRQAQLDMLREKGRSSPYFWAGFSLQGEWR